jgi:thioester reductase-like protein
VKTSADEIDGVMHDWAAQARRLLQLENTGKVEGDDALTRLQATSAALAGLPSSRLTGAAAAVQGTLRAMPMERRQLVALHVLHTAVPVSLKARYADLSPTGYFVEVDRATAFVRGYLGAAGFSINAADTRAAPAPGTGHTRTHAQT